jgi:hypothetical protein
MNKGILIFAHNSREIDYGLMSLIAGKLASKSLKVPVSLATDRETKFWLQKSGKYELAEKVFDQIIEIDSPLGGNKRKIYDGDSFKIVPFENYSRADAWDITPYEHTLLIDSDFLIFSDNLNQYWEIDSDFLIASGVKDIYDQNRMGYNVRYVSDTGTYMFWATTVMFKKTPTSRTYFQLIDYIRKNYRYYSDLFRFDGRQYRNDRSFSVAKHILDGFETDFSYNLPDLLTVRDRDILHSVNNDGKICLLINQGNEIYFPATIEGMDLHVMNKQSIIRNAERLLDLS